ncbi:hypothetical protein F8M49_21705 [Rhodococcus zopfii]|uniref:Uncharacterized protein n=1 Tax=Rhodococcus zopfii TaxID=43772 RepID=A0ABU3WTH9_9NOCA|nr:hypothetical protein [Rhodococcus zopfii]
MPKATLKLWRSSVTVVSRGLGIKQRLILDAVDERRDELFMGRTHRWRWFNLEMCGFVAAETSRSELVSLRRAVNSLDGILFETAASFPYNYYWFPWRRLWEVGPLDRRGQKLWFRPLPQDAADEDAAEVDLCLRDGLLSDRIDSLPSNDVLRADFGRWFSERREDADLDGFASERWWEGMKGSERGRLLAWIFFGLLPE